jgi:hypothetical protein
MRTPTMGAGPPPPDPPVVPPSVPPLPPALEPPSPPLPPGAEPPVSDAPPELWAPPEFVAPAFLDTPAPPPLAVEFPPEPASADAGAPLPSELPHAIAESAARQLVQIAP